MRPPVAEPVVDWGELLDVVWASVLGGVGVTCAFAIFILGATRAVDMRRGGNPAFAGVYAALAAVALAAVVAAVVLGIVVMTSKD